MLKIDTVYACNLQVGQIIKHHSDFYYVTGTVSADFGHKVGVMVAPVNNATFNPLLQSIVDYNKPMAIYA